MRGKILAAIILSAFLGVSAKAQDDAQATLKAAAQALGADSLNTLQYSGTGTVNTFGQNWKHDVQWPEFKLNSYTAQIDYKVPAMRVELVRDNPDPGKPLQGGGYPLLTPVRSIQAVSGKIAWNVVGKNSVPDPTVAGDRALEIWSTPQGVIKAAEAAGSNVKAESVKNAKGDVTGTILSFPVGNTTMRATITKDNTISRVEYTVDTPMLGDTRVTVLYSGYQDYNGVKFPGRMARLEGAVPSQELDSYQTLTMTVSNVMPNASVSLTVPDNVQQAAGAPPAAIVPTVDKIADGVYLVTGQGPNSVAVEFSDYVVLIEAPLNDAVVTARFDAVHKAIPNKPIKYVVSTHHHFDHAGGVRAAVALGATLIVPGWSRVLYDKVMLAPHTLNPDMLTKDPKKPVIQDVGTAFGTGRDMLELTDSKQTLRVYRVLDSQEADDMLFVYLPNQKILVEADMFTLAQPDPAMAAPAGGGRQMPLIITPEPLVLMNNIKRLNLDVDTIVPLHGRPAKMSDLTAAIE